MVADIVRNICNVVLSNVTDLTKPALWSSVAVLGTPLFLGGYLLTSLAIPMQTVHAEIAEVVARPAHIAVGLCNQFAVRDSVRLTDTASERWMPIELPFEDQGTFPPVGLHCANQLR